MSSCIGYITLDGILTDDSYTVTHHEWYNRLTYGMCVCIAEELKVSLYTVYVCSLYVKLLQFMYKTNVDVYVPLCSSVLHKVMARWL